MRRARKWEKKVEPPDAAPLRGTVAIGRKSRKKIRKAH
jgi:hypothetical protein